MINVAVSADRAVLDNKIGISFDFSSSVLHHGSARAGGERPGRGARRWGRGMDEHLHAMPFASWQGRR